VRAAILRKPHHGVVLPQHVVLTSFAPARGYGSGNVAAQHVLHHVSLKKGRCLDKNRLNDGRYTVIE
jgi:hypothetical protein